MLLSETKCRFRRGLSIYTHRKIKTLCLRCTAKCQMRTTLRKILVYTMEKKNLQFKNMYSELHLGQQY